MTGARARRIAGRLTAIIGIAAVVACLGCGKEQKPTEAAPAPKTSVPLPDWAPENPSPEFLRAAKVLKPFPLGEMLRGPEGNDASTRAQVAYATRVWSAAYEFFGTLNDDQTERFLSSKDKHILIPVGSLTPKQRAALDAYFEASRQAGKDRLVELYKCGANKDLSNVETGFSARGRSVHISCRVRSGSNYSGFDDTIAGM